MWRALIAATCLAALIVACSGGADEPPQPTSSPSYWSLQVCDSASIDLNLLDPSTDPRFSPGTTVSVNDDPRDVVAFRIDLTVRNLRNTVDYLELVREPADVTEFHEALIVGARTLAGAVEDARDDILAADSLDEVQTVYDELKAVDDQRLDALQTTAQSTFTPVVVTQIDDRLGCWEHLRIERVGTSDVGS